MIERLIYPFNEGSAEMVKLLGEKGANLSEMSKMGLPVPYGFIVSTKCAKDYFDAHEELGEEIKQELRNNISELEEITGKTFGSGDNPLLVSVRTSSAVNLPTLPQAILNVGLNDSNFTKVSEWGENLELAYDNYTRLIRMFGVIVRKIPNEYFVEAYENIKKKSYGSLAEEDVLRLAVSEYKRIIEKNGRPFPEDPYKQLEEAVSAMIGAWNSMKSINYRDLNEISDEVSLAVIVQKMVFGNADTMSAYGDMLTRNPETGEKVPCGTFAIKRQFGDVDFNDTEELPISEMTKCYPDIDLKLKKIGDILEKSHKDMQEIHFTIEKGKLYILQARSGNRSPEAALKIATDLVSEGIQSRKEALNSLNIDQINKLVVDLIKDDAETDEVRNDFNQVLSWADEKRSLGVRANVDNVKDVELALRFGAEGIGLLRTEHMFFADSKVKDFIHLLTTKNLRERKKQLSNFRPSQEEVFREVFEIMEDKPVTIRLLDPTKDLRGANLAVNYPEVAEVQTEAIIAAAISVKKNKGINPRVEILVPFVSSLREFMNIKETIKNSATKVMEEMEESIDYSIGSMIETPRACLLSDKLAEKADFLSLGTNDLTEMTYGIDRDKSKDLISLYEKKDILSNNPFVTLDKNGVGELIKISITKARKTKSNIKIGLLGDQSSDFESIRFISSTGVSYVSCPVLRLPGTRVAAAQVEVEE